MLKQSTSVDVPIGPFIDDADGKTAETALTITQPDIRLKKNGGAWAQKAAAQTLSHEENGNYEVTLDATDTNTLGLLRVHVAESGALPVWEDFMVMPANVWDSLFGADKLQVDVQEMANDVITDAVIATDAEIDIAEAVWDALTADHVVANTFGATIGTGASAATIADAVWDEVRSGHVAGGSFGEGVKVASSGIPVGAYATGAINAAALANDTGLKPLRSGTAQAGATGTITFDAGASAIDNFYQYQMVKIESGTGAPQSRLILSYVGATKVATVSQDWTTNPDNTSVFTIGASGVLGAEIAPTATENADELLKRDWTAVTGEASRSLLNAMRFNRNKFTIVGTTLTVYEEDDSTPAWTATITRVAADAISSIDP